MPAHIISKWRPPDEPAPEEIPATIHSRSIPGMRMPRMCALCGAREADLGQGEGQGASRLHDVLRLEVREPAVGCFGEYLAEADLTFPACEGCLRAGKDVAEAVRILGVRGHFDGFTISLALRNRPFAEALGDAAAAAR